MLLSKSKVYELALSSVKEEHVADFFKKYIPNVLPILTEYGGKFLMTGIIQSSLKNKFPAKSFALLEWPSISAFTDIVSDERMVPLLEERNRYLEFTLEGCFYSTAKDIDFPIPENRKMGLLLSDRAIPDERGIRLQWINDLRNRKLSMNLYVSNNLSQEYDTEQDFESYIIQTR